MRYDVVTENSILGASSMTNEPFGGGFRQAAIVSVKNEYNLYGIRVFLGCSGKQDEQSIYQDVAGLGDEISFDFIERLYLAMRSNKERNLSK